jgi:hypothetical protein
MLGGRIDNADATLTRKKDEYGSCGNACADNTAATDVSLSWYYAVKTCGFAFIVGHEVMVAR